MKDLLQDVAQVISGVLKAQVDSETDINNCPSWDSLNFLLVVSSVEEKFNVQFSPDEIPELISVKRIVEAVREKIV